MKKGANEKGFIALRNNYLPAIITALFLIISFSTLAQVYQVDPAYGRQIDRYKARKTLLIPTVCGVPTLQSTDSTAAGIAYDSCNAKFYVYNPSLNSWGEITGGGSVALAIDSAYRNPGDSGTIYRFTNSTTFTILDKITKTKGCYVKLAGTGPSPSLYDSLICPIDSLIGVTLADSNYLKLTGTDAGNPVTGDIRNLSAFTAYTVDSDAEAKVFVEDGSPIIRAGRDGVFTDINNGSISMYGVYPDANITRSVLDGAVTIGAINTSRGLIGSSYFPNKDSLTYAQMQDIADSMALVRDSIAAIRADIGTGGIQSIVAGSNITVDNTDPINPVVSSTGGGGTSDTLFFNVKKFGAVGDSTTDDRAAVLATIAAANAAGGGVVFFPAGRYRISDSILLTKSIRIMGVSSAGAIGTDFDWSGSTTAQNNIAPVQYSSVIYSGANKSVFVLDTASDGSHPFLKVENLAFVGDTLGTATYGSFITVRGNIQDVVIENCSFYGGYIQVALESAMYQKVIFNHFSSPTLYALLMNNDQRPDTGDGFIMGNVFSSGKHSTTTAKAIYWLGGGGRIITSNKFDATSTTKNTQFVWDIDGTNPLAITSVINISSNSFENYQTGAIRFNMVNEFFYMQILNNQFAGYNATSNAIDLTNVDKANINSNTISNGGALAMGAIKLTNSTQINVYSNVVDDYTSIFTQTGGTRISSNNELEVNVNATEDFKVQNLSGGASARSRLSLGNNTANGAYMTLWGSGTGFPNKTFFEADKDFTIGVDASTASGGTSKFQIYTNGFNSASSPQFTFDGNGAMGIGNTSPSTKSILDLTSTTKGLLLPRMTKTQRDAITSVPAGLMIYQTDNTPGLRVYNGTNWMRYTETID